MDNDKWDKVKNLNQGERSDSSVENQNLHLPDPPRRGGLKSVIHWNVKPQYPWSKAIRASISIGIPFIIGALINHIDWALLFSIGCYTTLYNHNDPYKKRAIKLAIITIGLVFSFALGLVSAGSNLSIAIAFALISGFSTFFSGAFKLPPPGGYFFVLVCAIGTIVPYDLSALPFRLGMAFLGGCFAWILSMSGLLWNPHKPKELIVSKVYKLLGLYIASIGNPSSDRAKHYVTAALYEAEDIVYNSSKITRRTKKEASYLQNLIIKANEIFTSAIELELDHDYIVANLSKRLNLISHLLLNPTLKIEEENLPYISHSSVSIRLQRDIEEAVQILMKKLPLNHQVRDRSNSSISSIITGSLDRQSIVLTSALRIGIAVFIATLIGFVLGNDRPYWVSLSCASALQGATIIAIVQRTIQRSIGTAVGIIIGGSILLLHESVWQLIVVIIILQLMIELLVVRNYAVAVVFITPLALIITYFSNQHISLHSSIEFRLLDTLLGSTIAFLSVVFLWHSTSTSRIPQQISETIGLSRELLQEMLKLNGSENNKIAYMRKRLMISINNLYSMYEGAISELRPNKKKVDLYWPAIVHTQRIAFQISVLKKEKLGLVETETINQISEQFNKMSEAAKNEQTFQLMNISVIPNNPSINQEIQALHHSMKIIKRYNDQIKQK